MLTVEDEDCAREELLAAALEASEELSSAEEASEADDISSEAAELSPSSEEASDSVLLVSALLSVLVVVPLEASADPVSCDVVAELESAPPVTSDEGSADAQSIPDATTETSNTIYSAIDNFFTAVSPNMPCPSKPDAWQVYRSRRMFHCAPVRRREYSGR